MAGETWISWAGLVPGDHVLSGRAGHQVWWQVMGWEGDVLHLRGLGGTATSGVPPMGVVVKVRPVANPADGPAMDRAAALVAEVLGAVPVAAGAPP